jgi:serine/threonine protein kinase
MSGVDYAAVAAQYGYIGFAVDPESGRVFYFTKALGSGASATTFAATSEPGQPAEWAIKDFWSVNIRPAGTELLQMSPDARKTFDEDTVDLIEGEARIGRMLRERLPAEVCVERLVCPIGYFYNVFRTRGSIVFPLVNSVSMRDWLRQWHCGSSYVFQSIVRGGAPELVEERRRLLTPIFAHERLLSQLGPDDWYRGSHERLIAEKRAELDAFDAQYRDVLREFGTFQMRMMLMAGSLLFTVAHLHRVNIYHGDIKPENLLIDANDLLAISPRLRLIDFGSACTTRIRRRADAPAACGSSLTATAPYRDPLSVRRLPPGLTQETRERLKALFDCYSVAKVIALIFDPDVCLDTMERHTFVRVRPSGFMPRGMYELLRKMVGSERTAAYTGFGPEEIDDADYEARVSQANHRPSAEEALEGFNQVFTEWEQLTNIAY